MQPLTARRPQRSQRRDPAPSKWAYRRQRWMLTPYVRLFVVRGLPTLAILGGIALWFGHEPNRQALIAQLTHLREEFEARPEFRISLARVEGASPELAEATSTLTPPARGSKRWMP
jgi:cell division protein FtsQ